MPGNRIRPNRSSQSAALDRAEVVRREQRPRHHDHARTDEHRGEERPRVHVGVAGALAEQEVGREHEQVQNREQVALERRAFGARTGDDHYHAEQGQPRVGQLDTRPPLAEHPRRQQQDEHRLQRRDEGGVDDRRLLERREAEDEAEREAHAGRERHHDEAERDAPAHEVRERHRDHRADSDPPEHDRRRRRVDPLDEQRPEAPREHRHRDGEQGKPTAPMLHRHERTLPELRF